MKLRPYYEVVVEPNGGSVWAAKVIWHPAVGDDQLLCIPVADSAEVAEKKAREKIEYHKQQRAAEERLQAERAALTKRFTVNG